MAHPEVHAESSAKRFGGKSEDYIAIHNWFDETKAWFLDMQHRAMRHHTEGIFEMEKLFGSTLVNSDGKKVFTRYVGEQHIIEDLGFVPTASDWLENFNMQNWMMNRDRRIKGIVKKNHGDSIPSSLSK